MSEDKAKTIYTDRAMIYEMINASFELAANKGKHPLENGCNCITCVNNRKIILNPVKNKWKFKL